jgi:hypothetical protein
MPLGSANSIRSLFSIFAFEEWFVAALEQTTTARI